MDRTETMRCEETEHLLFEEKAKRLKRLVAESATLDKIREAAQKAAESRRVLNAYLKDAAEADREKFIYLRKQFLEIEDEAWVKFYKTFSVGPRGTLPI
jgi:hypothetical protein